MQRVTFQGRLVKLGKQKTLCLRRVAGLLFGFSCIWFSYLGLPSTLEVWEKKRVTPKLFFSSCSVASSNPWRGLLTSFGDIPIADPLNSDGASCSVTAGTLLSFSIPPVCVEGRERRLGRHLRAGMVW